MNQSCSNCMFLVDLTGTLPTGYVSDKLIMFSLYMNEQELYAVTPVPLYRTTKHLDICLILQRPR